MKEYIGREKEINLLQKLTASSEAELAIVYGRRRIGKSSLIAQAYKDKLLFSFEGLEEATHREQLENFYNQLADYFPGVTQKERVCEWYAALSLLYSKIKNTECVILLDELQWLANYQGHFVSIFKQVWDQKFSKNQKLTMVLCGSIASFMVNKVIKSRALYGRSTANIHLEPFKLKDTKNFLKGRSSEEVIQAHILVGGIPGYLNKLRLYDSVYLGLQQLAFEAGGYFTAEFEKIFVSQFGRSANYQRIVRYLAEYRHGLTRKQLTSLPGIRDGGTLSHCLLDLAEAGLIGGYSPFNSPPRTKKRLYLLCDPFCRFYLSFVEPNLERIKSGVPNLFTGIIKTPAFYSWMGVGADLLCYQHPHELAKIMGFGDISYRVGPLLNMKAEANQAALQIDLVYERKDAVITACEIKYAAKIGLEVVAEMKEKLEKLQVTSSKTVQAALIYKVAPSIEVKNSMYFNHLVSLEELANV